MSVETGIAEASFTRYPLWRRWFGSASERIAGRHLRRLGFRILARNQQDRRGEIDLLAIDAETLVVVEVRSTETGSIDRLLQSVNYEKQKRLSSAALRYLQRRRLLGKIAVRFDVLAIRRPTGEPIQVEHIRNSFQATGKFQLHS